MIILNDSIEMKGKNGQIIFKMFQNKNLDSYWDQYKRLIMEKLKFDIQYNVYLYPSIDDIQRMIEREKQQIELQKIQNIETTKINLIRMKNNIIKRNNNSIRDKQRQNKKNVLFQLKQFLHI